RVRSIGSIGLIRSIRSVRSLQVFLQIADLLNPLFPTKFPLSATIGNVEKYSFAKLSGSGNYTY
ncbi:hypothetical protein L249_4487, partial [Ophiocordyceps polyrhachis-furcata BCC 54312]